MAAPGTTSTANAAAGGRRTEHEIEHRIERCGVPSQPTAQRGPLPAVDQQARQAFHIGIARDVAPFSGLFQADGQTRGDAGKARSILRRNTSLTPDSSCPSPPSRQPM